jgi:hypothetical protein
MLYAIGSMEPQTLVDTIVVHYPKQHKTKLLSEIRELVKVLGEGGKPLSPSETESFVNLMDFHNVLESHLEKLEAS